MDKRGGKGRKKAAVLQSTAEENKSWKKWEKVLLYLRCLNANHSTS